jgi:cellulose biosynthesis protein BcsQ
MKIFASYNIKGGVGKTASAVNLAFLSARSGARTLVWDLDPQGAASFYFRVKPRIKGGAERLFGRKKHGVRKAIRGTDYAALDLLPADFSNRHLDSLLDRQKKPTKPFKRLLKTIYKDYDHVFLDCAPTIGAASECVFEIADVLLVPSIPTTLSMNTLEQLGRHLRKTRKRPPLVLPFFSMVDKRKSLHKAVMADATDLPFDILETRIPYSSTIERMGTERAPVHAFAANSRPAAKYERLFREITSAA